MDKSGDKISEIDVNRNLEKISSGEPLDIPLRQLKYHLSKDKINIPTRLRLRKCPSCRRLFYTTRLIYCSDRCLPNLISEYNKIKYLEIRNHPTQMIKMRLRDRMRDAFRTYLSTGKIRKASNLIDYPAVIEHIGPCPGNRREWVIDHKVPMKKFNFKKKGDIKKAFAPSNTQWMKKSEHIKKSIKERQKV